MMKFSLIRPITSSFKLGPFSAIINQNLRGFAAPKKAGGKPGGPPGQEVEEYKGEPHFISNF